MRFRGRGLVEGRARGEALVVWGPISFLGDVDPETGELRDGTGRSVAGRILVFESGRGSTVGSYVIYALAENGVAPKAMVVLRAEPIIVAGCVLAGIPLVDRVPKQILETTRDGDLVEVDAYRGEVIVHQG